MERNQVLYSQATGSYYFVPLSRVGAASPTTRMVVGKKIDVTSSVLPLVAYAVAGHLRRLAKSSVFNGAGYRKLMDAANEVEKTAGIEQSAAEG